ncbi:MAG TPA: nitroreductase family deazaflavin-dependent oxidoreductase [Candidatus Binataceae bacterium]|nr:nitroreductase family deazaflavin-dependent oxidoreductase [Candidatus Binataceae bacterium]
MANSDRNFVELTGPERFLNRAFGLLVKLGLSPGYNRLLEVPGRKSGRIYTTPVNLLEMDGRRYLVASRGETAWARNARAAGRVTLRRGARTERFALRELAVAEKPPILKEFLRRYRSQVQRFYPVAPDAPVDAFRPVAAVQPVFELVAESSAG